MPGFGGLPGTQQLRIKYRDTHISPLLTERTDLVPEFVKVIVRQGVSFMPHFARRRSATPISMRSRPISRATTLRRTSRVDGGFSLRNGKIRACFGR